MRRFFLLFLTVITWLSTGHVLAAEEPKFQVQSLTANYYLDRDPQGISTLSAEEVFNIAFPTSGASFSGFNRSLPTQYLKNTNALKVTSVTDVGGSSIAYRTSYDKDRNLVISIGDPAITVYGSQTYILRYQAKGVINFLGDKEEFYPNFNGRGWNSAFGAINGTIHISDSLAAQLKSEPQCLIDSGRCQVKKQAKDNQVSYEISAKNPVPAHQSLTAKLDFKNDTFKPYKLNQWSGWLKTAGAVFGVLVVLAIGQQLIDKAKKPRKPAQD